MRTLALAALAPLALALSACGGGGDETAANDAAFADDNMLMDENLLLDANVMNGMEGVDANMANTANMMATDAVTNDADTNLANGL